MIADPPDAGRLGKTADRFSIGVTGASVFWNKARIPYRVDDSLVRQVGRWRLIDADVAYAILYWNGFFPGLFVERTNEADYVTIRRVDTGCYANVDGRDGGEQFVNLATSCSTGNIVHELGHVIGLHHEQTREDRDDFVQIVWSNILNGKEPQFEQHNSQRQDIGPYDYGSMMH